MCGTLWRHGYLSCIMLKRCLGAQSPELPAREGRKSKAKTLMWPSEGFVCMRSGICAAGYPYAPAGLNLPSTGQF